MKLRKQGLDVKKIGCGILLSVCLNNGYAQTSMQQIIQQHLDNYSETEHFSGIQVSIKVADHEEHYAVGLRALDNKSPSLSQDDLFNIGSITKSFTAAIAVLAESEKKINLSDNLEKYISNYPHWGDISLTALLNMSSGIPNYSNAPKINYLMSQNLQQLWTPEALLALVYPVNNNPPRVTNFFYSNTGYVLLDMILTKAYQEPFDKLIATKTLKPLALNNTFYPVPTYPPEVLARLAHGYSYNIYDNPELLGQDVTENNLSWAGAAGALVSNSKDVVHWIEDLFINDKLLTPEQKAKMQHLISTTTNQPISHVSLKDPRGFGLGIVEAIDEKMGRYWFYEGQTLGYRAFYMYNPCNKVIIVALFNSSTNSENDHGGELLQQLFQQIKSQNKLPACE